MTLVVKDRVKETTTTTGTGTITLAGAVTGYQAFSVIGNGSTTYYVIEDANGTDWEVGIGTYTLSGTTLARTDVLASTNSNNEINLSSGTHTVFCGYPAGKSVHVGANIDIGDFSFTAQTLVSDVATGTAPITVSSTTKVANLNADKLDDQEGSYYLDFSNFVVDAGEIPIAKLASDSVSFGGITVALGASDATPAFDLSDATNYPTSSLSGTITNAQLAGSIANAKLANDSVSFGGITVALGASDATPAFDLSDATNYPTSSLSGTITNAQLAGSIANAKLANDSVSFGGITVALGASDATPAFDLADATNYPTSSLSGTITNAQLAGSIANAKLANDSVSFGGITVALGASDATPAFDLSDATNYPTSSLSGTITNAQLAGSIANAKLANSAITVAVGSDSTAISLGGTMTFAGTANEVEVAESSGTVTIGLPSSITANVTGDLTGNADTATNATNATHVSVADNESTDENNLIPFIEDASATGNVGLESDGDFHYNPSTGTVSATHFRTTTTNLTNQTGSISINAALGNYFTVATTGNITVDIQNAVVGQKILIRFAWGGDHTLGFANTTVIWPGGTAPGTTASGVDMIGFLCTTASSAFDGFIVGEDIKAS